MVPARAETPLQAGEEMVYSVRWAIIPGAGEIRISAAEEEGVGEPRLVISTQTETRGIAGALMKFHARSDSVFELKSGRMLSLEESSVTRSKRENHSMQFEYPRQRALFVEKEATEPRTLALPEGDPADLITTLMKTRLWNLEVGASRDVLVAFKDEFYELTVRAVRAESVRTSLGSFDTVVLEPRMEKTPPKGMFKRGANVRVWVSRDEARLPVRFQVDFKLGTGVATLVRYTPPDTASGTRVVADE